MSSSPPIAEPPGGGRSQRQQQQKEAKEDGNEVNEDDKGRGDEEKRDKNDSSSSSKEVERAKTNDPRREEREKEGQHEDENTSYRNSIVAQTTTVVATAGTSSKNTALPSEVSLVGLGRRVDAAWARVQKLQAEVAKGAALLEGESVRLNIESASRNEELQVVSSLMLAMEEKCATHQKRLTYHFRLGKALDQSYQTILDEEAVVEGEIAALKEIAREAQLQSSLANSAVCEAVESVSGLRVELWTLRRELEKTNDAINALRQRQWALEDALDAVDESLFAAREREREMK